jgi:peptide/nickel transport system substrate-binding protein
MSFFSKISSFFSSLNGRLVDFNERRKIQNKIDQLDRSDILLTHRLVARRRFPSVGQWRLLGRVLKTDDRRRIGWSIAAIFFGLLLLVGRWLGIHAVLVPADGGEYREGMVGTPHAINPILAGGNEVDQSIVKLVFSGLYKRDINGELVFDLVQDATMSADGKTLSLVLKKGPAFHDGQPVTAGDVVFTLNAILNPAWKSPLAKNLGGLSANAVDDQTVSISSSVPIPYAASLLTFGILPKHVWEKIDPASRTADNYNLRPVGSGPFKFEKFTVDRSGSILSYTLRSANWSGAKLDHITFKFYNDYDSAVDKLESNAIDGLNFVPPGKRDQVQAVPNTIIRTPTISQYTAIFLNPKHLPALGDAKIRAALAYAIDREKIIEKGLHGLATKRDAPIAEGDAGYSDKITRYGFDPARSAKLLDEAGYKLDDVTKTRAKATTTQPKSKNEKSVTTLSELKLELTTIDTEENRAAAEIVKEGWEAIGVPTDVITVAANDLQKSVIRPREYDTLLLGEVLPPDSDPYPYWSSSQIADGLNLSAYSNRRVDELLEKARLAVNEASRNQLLSEFEQIVTSDVPAIFLYQPDYLYPQASEIKNFNVKRMASPADRFADITNWYRRLRVVFK